MDLDEVELLLAVNKLASELPEPILRGCRKTGKDTVCEVNHEAWVSPCQNEGIGRDS